MAATVNGLSLSKLRAFGATFFIFSDYASGVHSAVGPDGTAHYLHLHARSHGRWRGRNDNPRLAFFGFALINTSLEPTSPVEETRLRMLDDLLREKLDASGRFRIVIIPPAARPSSKVVLQHDPVSCFAPDA